LHHFTYVQWNLESVTELTGKGEIALREAGGAGQTRAPQPEANVSVSRPPRPCGATGSTNFNGLITRHGRPAAVLMGYDEWQRLTEIRSVSVGQFAGPVVDETIGPLRNWPV
jgi:Antitoxin Phd_YefM, type II toxin-antitoxin system